MLQIHLRESSMAGRERAGVDQGLQRLRRERAAEQQAQQQFALMLEVQTMSLMLNDLRSRVSEIEKHLGIGQRSPGELVSPHKVTPRLS
jgi:hypothetical protein